MRRKVDWSAVETLIRLRVSKYGLTIGKHAKDRMSSRGIQASDINNCFLCGKIIEEQRHEWDTKYLFQGTRSDGSPFYTVIAISEEGPYVVTVCEPYEDAWMIINGQMRRK